MDKQQRGIQVIRIWPEVMMLIYGVMEIMSLEGTLAFSANIGLPSPLVYGVATVELVGGLLMAIGFLVPLVPVGFIAVLVGTTFSFGLVDGFSGYECELFLVIISLTILVSCTDKKYLTLKLYS